MQNIWQFLSLNIYVLYVLLWNKILAQVIWNYFSFNFIKKQKSEPDLIFLYDGSKASGAVCKPDWHNVRSYLFFYVWKFQTQCAMTISPVTTLMGVLLLYLTCACVLPGRSAHTRNSTFYDIMKVENNFPKLRRTRKECFWHRNTTSYIQIIVLSSNTLTV